MSKGFFIGSPSSSGGGDADTVNGHMVESDVPENAKFTDTVYTHPSSHPVGIITGLHDVAISGNYEDLTNKPSIPAQLTKLSQLENDERFVDGAYDNTESGLTATTLQEAIDELKALIDGLNG